MKYPNLYLYNSISRSKELFVPLDTTIKMYVCGPTVYDFAHLGNARAMIVFDVLYRMLLQKYKQVIYVRNITDIDDKICLASTKLGCSFSEIATRFEQEFQTDMQALRLLEPTQQPKATEFIEQMIDMIASLVEKNFAYEAEGHVMFELKKYEKYGHLSRKNNDELLAGARIEIASYKKTPEDFVLWKPSENGSPGWDSPWGRGRPGWHIECSAMSNFFLGSIFDIHCGGIDLIFPHHDNEIAQSCCFSGEDRMANYWVHNGHLTVDGKKMSKSLGNFFTVRELLQYNNFETVKLAMLMTHYRQPLDWNNQSLVLSKKLLDKIYSTIKKITKKNSNLANFKYNELFEKYQTQEDFQIIVKKFIEALFDDMNTPLAIQEIMKINRNLEKFLHEDTAELYLTALLYCGNQLGLLSQTTEEWFPEVIATDISTELIEQKLRVRNLERKNKNFVAADKIREELLNKGIVIYDLPDGSSSWKNLEDEEIN